MKRRRLSPPPPRAFDIFDEDDSQQTAVGEDFEMLDGPQSLPWVPMNPASQHSEYVPPGLNALIDGAFPHSPLSLMLVVPCNYLHLYTRRETKLT